MKNRLKCIVITVLSLVLLIFVGYGFYNPLSVTKITVCSDKINNPVKIALICDLHSCDYGTGQVVLTDIIDKETPDIVCLVGDIFDDKHPDDNAEILIKGISGKYPCFYVTGNHEFDAGTHAFSNQMEILQKNGVIRLANESRDIELNGQKIKICGVDDPNYDLFNKNYHIHDALYDIQNNLQSVDFSVLLSHRPEYFSLYVDCGFDLVLSGHAHGGMWSIPVLLSNGIFAPDQGLFPKYTNGVYTSDKTTMIVSRGLERKRRNIPRFYNRPEIVIINLQKTAI